MASSDFHLFTSLRYDPLLLSSSANSHPSLSFTSPSPLYMLVYHRDRLLEAAQHFEFPKVAEKLADGTALHEALLKHVKRYIRERGEDGPLKVRVAFEKNGEMAVDLIPVAEVGLSALYPSSFDPPKAETTPTPQQQSKPFTPSPLTGGALMLGPTDSLSPSQQPPQSTSIGSNEWLLRLDTQPTPSSPFTLLKTTQRDVYNTSRSRALPSNPANPKNAEVLLYNECAELTEGSITSLYFFRGGRWVTPPVGVPAGQFTTHILRTLDSGKGEDERWDEGELRKPFAGRWGHSLRSEKVGAGGQRGTTRRWALGRGLCMEETVGVDSVEVGEGAWVSNGVVGFGFGRVVE